jgi:hypothetical protein
VPAEWKRPTFYGEPSDHEPLAWDWVDEQLRESGTYWVVAGGMGPPHPRPVWGVWREPTLWLSIGSPALRAALGGEPRVAVHLESGTDVVVLEGRVRGPSLDEGAIDAYDRKYDWSYDVAQYGPLTVVAPTRILAWQAAGWAGREGFRRAGRWEFGA